MLAIVVALLLVLAALWGLQGAQPLSQWRPERFHARAGVAAALAAFAGFAELVSRYRDQPWQAAGTTAGLTYIVINALTGAAALALLEHFHSAFNAPDDGILRVVLAGTGAMVILRSKLFTIRNNDGTDVEVGPAYAVERLLTAVNSDIDRPRAKQRHDLVTRNAKGLATYRFSVAKPFLQASILAFQTMEQQERDRLTKTLDSYAADETIEDEIKFIAAGFDFVTAFGDRTYAAVFAALLVYLKDRPAAPPARLPAA